MTNGRSIEDKTDLQMEKQILEKQLDQVNTKLGAASAKKTSELESFIDQAHIKSPRTKLKKNYDELDALIQANVGNVVLVVEQWEEGEGCALDSPAEYVAYGNLKMGVITGGLRLSKGKQIIIPCRQYAQKMQQPASLLKRMDQVSGGTAKRWKLYQGEIEIDAGFMVGYQAYIDGEFNPNRNYEAKKGLEVVAGSELEKSRWIDHLGGADSIIPVQMLGLDPTKIMPYACRLADVSKGSGRKRG